MKKLFKNLMKPQRGSTTVTAATITASATAGAASVGAAWAGDNVMAWVMLGINIITLLSNLALEIYRKWRDKDKDDSEGKKK